MAEFDRKGTGQERPIYLDHQATTPVDPRVASVVLEAMTTRFGNAASVDHFYGEEAAGLLEIGATEVGALVGAPPDQVRFTSGATDAIRLALQIAVRRADRPLRIASSRAEHRAVLDAIGALRRAGAAEIRWLSVDSRGQVLLDDLEAALADGVDLVCLMAANNEVGTLYPVETVAARVRDAGIEILIDATQAAGLVDLNVDAWGLDYLVLSGHKLYGPKGVGALIGPGVRSHIVNEITGHDGTPNVPGAAGLGMACRIARDERPVFEAHLRALRDRMEAALKSAIPSLVINGDPGRRLVHNLHVSVPGAPNHAVVARLRREVAVSTGAACTSGAQEPSHVLRAMGLSEDLQETALRISPGRFTAIEEVDRAAAAIARAVSAVRWN